MDLNAKLYMFLLGMAVTGIALNMVRTGKLQERYALLWILAGLALAISPFFANQLDAMGKALGFEYTPALLLMMGIVGLLLIIFQISLTISQSNEQLKVVSQEVGILRQQVDSLSRQLESNGVIGRPGGPETSHSE
ncbi:MAG: DUF2304 domain-containing protein [Chloroflexota bacterium]|nr:DUF2304 domain-containing protein [Chloroflexota bacterium]